MKRRDFIRSATQTFGEFGLLGLVGKVNMNRGNELTRVACFSQYLEPVEKKGLRGFIDVRTNTLAITFRFRRAHRFCEGMAAAVEAPDDLWGYIDPSGTFTIPQQFLYAMRFSGGLAEVSFPNHVRAYINKLGKQVITLDRYQSGWIFQHGVTAINLDVRREPFQYRLMRTNGTWVSDAIFDKIPNIFPHGSRVLINGAPAYVRHDGEVIPLC